MKKVNNHTITSNQFMFMLMGSMIGIGILSLPNDVVKNAKQDGWISAFIGMLYPLYVVMMAGLIQKKFPNKNILYVNKRCFGKIIGTLFNIFLLSFFLLYLTSEISGITNIIRTVIVNFLSPVKVQIVFAVLGAYSVYSGLKVLGRVNETIFYIIVFMCLFMLAGIIKGSILNVRPIFGSGIGNIAKSSFESAYQYAGMEIYLFLYPYVSGSKNKQKLAYKATIITGLIYTWITFVTIYSIGINLIPNYIASVPVVARLIDIPVINNFRFIFMVLWSLIVINIISNYYYVIVETLASMAPKISSKVICVAICPFVVLLSLLYINDTIRKDFLGFVVPKLTIVMMMYILITVIMIYFRKEEDLE